ncbi:MAG: RNase adapter RapZ [Gemmatimonadaceae bacterium]|nr:RNase adapter RapZ [Gloeobacterales cyanobacterium ES-bin-141]
MTFNPVDGPLNTVLVTSVSGAGKTEATRILEDLGFLCLNHVSPGRISTRIADYEAGERLALVLEYRPGRSDPRHSLTEAHFALKEVGRLPLHLFLDCDEEVLLRRYALSRRPHPWADGEGLLSAIRHERRVLAPVRDLADLCIDTSAMSVAQLRGHIESAYRGTKPDLPVTLMSFGFKYGIPTDAQFVLDIRFLPNPYYDLDLRPQSGKEVAVRDYVFAGRQAQETYSHIFGLLKFLLVRYHEDRRSQLLLAVGCTGGQHRSVAFIERLSVELTGPGYQLCPVHRDLERNRLTVAPALEVVG